MSDPEPGELAIAERALIHEVIRSHSACADPECKPGTCSIQIHGRAVARLLEAYDQQASRIAGMTALLERLVADKSMGAGDMADAIEVFLSRAPEPSTEDLPCPGCGRPMARVGGPGARRGWTCVNCNAAGDPEEDH